MRRRSCQLLAVAIMAAAVAGCGATSDPATGVALSALDVTAPPPKPLPPTKSCVDPHLTASLRPPATLPAPARMPAGSFMATIQRRGYLIAGVNAGNLHFGSLNPFTGQIEGFEIDLVRQVAGAIFGNPNAFQLRSLTINQRIPFVQQGNVDIAVDAITITCARKKQVDFSTVYYDAKQRVLVPVGSPVRGVQDLGGKRVCAGAGSTPLDVIAKVQPRAIEVPKPQTIDCLVALQQDRVAAISTDDSILKGFTAQDPNTRIVGLPVGGALGDVPYGMAISKSHTGFVRFVNGVLAQIRANGTWRSLYTHWLGRPTLNPPPAQYDG